MKQNQLYSATLKFFAELLLSLPTIAGSFYKGSNASLKIISPLWCAPEFLEEERTCLVFYFFFAFTEPKSRSNKRQRNFSECIWHWDLLSSRSPLSLECFPLWNSPLMTTWELYFSETGGNVVNHRQSPWKLGFFSCCKQSFDGCKTPVCMRAAHWGISSSRKPRRAERWNWNFNKLRFVCCSEQFEHRKQLLSNELSSEWGQRAAGAWCHIHTNRSGAHFLRISVPLLRYLWQKEPHSDVNWSKVFPRSYLNLITPMKAAPHPTPSARHYYRAQTQALFIISPIFSHVFRVYPTTAELVAAFKTPGLWDEGRGARHRLSISRGNGDWADQGTAPELSCMAIIPRYLLNGHSRDILCWVFERTKFEF